MHILERIYHALYGLYGPQGWWPLLGLDGQGHAKTGSREGYHPLRYNFPATDRQIFEICTGAILTQNTAWTNVVPALKNLDALGALDPARLIGTDDAALKAAIRPAGYYNQKAKKLREFARFYLALRGRTPSRDELLGVWGIGRETADSMLLYAFHVPVFVVDAYTRRIFSHLGIIGPEWEYDRIRHLVEAHVAPDVPVYQEYHALLVEHAKRHYRRGGDWNTCPLRPLINA